MKITFLGAVETVTGSRYLLEQGSKKILVDCGMFQGPHEISERNMDPFPVDPKTIDAIVLTHAHIDHSGYIPALVKNGFKGPIYCSEGTFALCALLLLDSGSLQERRANEVSRGGPDHPPTTALYTAQDAQNSLKFFKIVEYDAVINIGTSFSVTLIRSGHILGSSFVIVSDGKSTLTFSGDLGRPHDAIMKTPTHLTDTDFLVIESTYGDRLHATSDPLKALADIINATVKKGGITIIPSFAVGRAQTILYCLYQLKLQKAIPDVPIFLDSPMAISATDLLCKFNDEHNLAPALCKSVIATAKYTRTREESMSIDALEQPAIVVTASGMADGGRVTFHLQHFIDNPKNTIAFVGFQAEGTVGHALVNGATVIELNEKMYTVGAEIKTLDMFSAHADYPEILEWLSYFKNAPKKVFVTHGEIESAQSLKQKIEERFGWTVVLPTYLESFDLE